MTGVTTPVRHQVRIGPARLVVSGPGVDLVGPDATTNRAAVAAELGVAADHLVLARQVHGDRVLEVTGPWPGPAPDADALVTATPGVAVGVLAADCMPLLLADPAAGVVAAVHVGRGGLRLGIAVAALARMRALGATDVLAQVGPTVCGRCYEVPAVMRDEIAASWPDAGGTTRAGTPSVDIVAGVRSQLALAGTTSGVRVQVDETWAECTIEEPTLFSHRRDAPTGRHGGFAVLTPAR